MGLSFAILKGITKRGYKIPTPVQRKTIPLILEGRNVVAMAKTGKFHENVHNLIGYEEFNDLFLFRFG